MASKGSLGTVLITGGCGYLGTEMVKIFCADPEFSSIHVISRNPTKNLHPGAQYHAVDITNSSHVASIFKKITPDIIIHCAVADFDSATKTHWNVTVSGTRVLLKCSAESPSVKAFVYTSSESAMLPSSKPINEEEGALYDEDSRENPYRITKAVADKEVRAASSPPTLLTTALRMPNLYGGNDDQMIGPSLKGIGKSQHKIQVGDDSGFYEFLYLEKAAESHLLAAKILIAEASGTISPAGKVNGEAFFISDDSPQHIFDFSRKVCALAGHPVAKEEIKIIPFGFVYAITIASEWLYWIFTLGTKRPEVSSRKLAYLNRDYRWRIDKAKERLGFVPAKQDEVLKKAVAENMKRLKL